MRTFVQLKLRQVEPPTTDEAVRKWLEAARLRPEPVEIPKEIRELLFVKDEIPKESQIGIGDTAFDHAINILLAIPRFDLERAHAIENAKYIIHLDDTAHSATMWGLVCIDDPTVTVRWRHRSTLSLERATEELITSVWENSGPEKLFHKFELGHRIPVREPLSTNDAYVGEVLGTTKARVMRAKEEKRSELRIAFFAAVTALVCTIGGIYTFLHSKPEDFVHWIGGALDRIATVALVTAAVSWLGYRFRRQELEEKPTINWQ